MGQISAIIIAFNESKHIADCIVSAQQVCDEVIVVVDSKTSDDTAAIAEQLGARVMHQEYLGDGPQKAVAVPLASNEWILALDADERLEDDAVEVIRQIDLSREDVDAYAFRRRNFVGDHWIKAAGFYPDIVTRLYHRQRAGYLPKKAHSSVRADNIVKLKAHLRHFTYHDYAHWMDRINKLSSRDAWAMYERGKPASKIAAMPIELRLPVPICSYSSLSFLPDQKRASNSSAARMAFFMSRDLRMIILQEMTEASSNNSMTSCTTGLAPVSM